MRATSSVCWFVLGVVASLSPNHLLQGKEPEFRLDHFKVYKVRAAKVVKDGVALRGQFDKEARKAEISGPLYFANPVSKNKEKIHDKDAHLNWYRLSCEREPRRKVAVHNQFGEQTILIGQPAFLLAPTKKVHDKTAFPLSKHLDHFKAYRVIKGKAIEKEVTLVDQFGDEKNAVLKPVLFCVPVAKSHGGKSIKIVNEKDHLVVYELKPHEHEIKFETSDQFSENTLKTTVCVWLCVPSAKTKYEEVRGRTRKKDDAAKQ